MDTLAAVSGSDSSVSIWLKREDQMESVNALHGLASTGDILLFSGRTWAAHSVRWMTNSPWSHVAVVVNEPLLYAEPLVLEATRCSSLKDILCGRCVGDGVQLVSLKEKITSYPGRVLLRCWSQPRQRPAVAEVQKVLESYGRRPYVDYVRKNIRQWLGLSREAGTFCSELVAEVLDVWGFLVPERPTRLYVPRHFADGELLCAEKCRQTMLRR